MSSESKNSNSDSIKTMDWPVFVISGGVVVIFVIAALINMDAVSNFVNATFGWSVKWFGAFWQVLCLLTVLISIGLAISKYGGVRLGGDKPDISTFRWISMIMCTLLAGGGVFWSAAEPMYHFLSTPPAFPGIEGGTPEAIAPALSYGYLHWGYNAWAILGSLTAVVVMYAAYVKGLPLKPRSMLYPVLGEKGVMNHWGTAADAFSIIAVAAGTIGPIGFLALQMSYFLNQLWGIPDAYTTQLAILLGLIAIYTISAVTGLTKGIQFLSRFNVVLAGSLMALILLVGPGGFIIDSFLTSFGVYTQNFVRITLFRGDTSWLGWWTVFFFGWFLGYGPMMAIFVARISKGRTIREIVLAVTIIAPIITNFWFTILGGTGIYYELANPGSVSAALDAAGLPAALLAIITQLPLSAIFIPAFMILIVIFLATTGDSMSFTIAMVVTGQENPAKSVRIFWAVMMGLVAAILINIGEGGIGALQTWIVFTAVPVSLLLLPMLWGAPMLAKRMYDEGYGIGDSANSAEEKTAS